MERVPSVYPDRNRSAWILAQRPPKAVMDPLKPHACFLEQERSASGETICSAGILLTNRECPWQCVMCDLWKHTLDRTVPVGAIPAQIKHALDGLGGSPKQVKLYNSGSFFDPAAIPLADYPPIAELVSFADNVVVETHPRLAGERAVRLRELLSGSLEVALGLETVHSEVLERLNKGFSLDDFDRAAQFLRAHDIAVRVFILVNPPFMAAEESLDWAVKSARFAFSRGATVVSLIPTRGGNGAMERLRKSGEFNSPRLDTLERALELCLGQIAPSSSQRVFADTWDLEQFASCQECLGSRRQRLAAMNLGQQVLPSVVCPACGGRAIDKVPPSGGGLRAAGK